MRKYIFALILPVLLSSCNNWLDVKPNDRISEDATFSTPKGFELALNGVYVDLNKPSLYGQELTWNFVEIMAQRYNIIETNKYDKNAMTFDHTSDEMKSRVQWIWSEAYSLIANMNLILKNCEEHREVLSDQYYALVKGETLGLRALMHFDLFRLWGPVYSLASDQELTIPYYTRFALASQPRLTAKAFMEHVIADLEEAAVLLADDPIKTSMSPLRPDAANVFLGYRTLRMNYYAVKLLLARAYLYVNDKPKALAAAKEVIEVQEQIFPWVDPATLTGDNENPDRVFSTELVFALQNSGRMKIYTGHFDANNLKLGGLLAMVKKVVEQNIFGSELSDLRYKTWCSQSVELEGGSYQNFVKYQAVANDSLYNQLIPMMRVSEAYYIAAECEGEEDAGAAMAWLNKVRNARLLQDYYWEDYWEYVLETEYMREFMGEGQLFFYYKRKNYNELYGPRDIDEIVKVQPHQYVLLIPEEESKYN